jgi:hypothetical protein
VVARSLVLGVLGLAGCLPRASGYRCEAAADCVSAGVAGRCEPGGYCSFPDPSCADGWRFGDYAGGFSDRCVGEAGDAGLSDAPAGFHRVGGMVSGLTVPSPSPLVLRNNASDDLAISSNGAFTFPTPLAEGASYAVSVASQPADKACSVIDAAGVIGLTDVTSVGVQCSSGAGRTIACPPSSTLVCAGTQNCCTDSSAATGVCQDPAATCGMNGEGKILQCDDAADCGGTAMCCAEYKTGNFKGTSCVSSCSGTETETWCDPAVASSCPLGTTCTPNTSKVGSGLFATCR